MENNLEILEKEIKELEEALSEKRSRELRNELRQKRMAYWRMKKRENPEWEFPERVRPVVKGHFESRTPAGGAGIDCLGQWNKDGDLDYIVNALNLKGEGAIQACPKCFKEMSLHGFIKKESRDYDTGWKTQDGYIGVCPGDYILRMENPGDGDLVVMDATAYKWLKRVTVVREFVVEEGE